MTTIVGNTTDVVEIRQTNSGTSVGNVTVAVNRKERDQDVTDYIDVTVWSTLAEHAALLAKGTRVIVVGTFKSRKYTTREGQERTAWFLDASAFGPELRFATAAVTRAGNTRRDTVPAQADTWAPTASYGDDTPF